MNSEVDHFMVRFINFERDRLPTQFKSCFQIKKSFRLKIITYTDNEVIATCRNEFISQNIDHATKTSECLLHNIIL